MFLDLITLGLEFHESNLNEFVCSINYIIYFKDTVKLEKKEDEKFVLSTLTWG